MTDREKVLKGLELCFDFNPPEYIRCSKCPYNSLPKKTNCQEVMIEDVVVLLKQQAELLKEQEAVEPKVSTAEQRCGHCNKVIEMDGWKACPWCGKRIDWKGWWEKNGTCNQDT